MKRIPFHKIKPGLEILLENEQGVYKAEVVSTTEGHLGMQEVRFTTGEVYAYELTPMYELSPEMRTEYLLRGDQIQERKKREPKEQ